MPQTYEARYHPGCLDTSYHGEGKRTIPGLFIEVISRGELGADDGFPLACPESEAGDEAEPLPAVDEHIGGGVEMLVAGLDGA